jgi:hypothetical protein
MISSSSSDLIGTIVLLVAVVVIVGILAWELAKPIVEWFRRRSQRP